MYEIVISFCVLVNWCVCVLKRQWWHECARKRGECASVMCLWAHVVRAKKQQINRQTNETKTHLLIWIVFLLLSFDVRVIIRWMGEVCLSECKHCVYISNLFVNNWIHLSAAPIGRWAVSTIQCEERYCSTNECRRRERDRDGTATESMCAKCGSYILIRFLSMHISFAWSFFIATAVVYIGCIRVMSISRRSHIRNAQNMNNSCQNHKKKKRGKKQRLKTV